MFLLLSYLGCRKRKDTFLKRWETDHLVRGEVLSVIQSKCTFVCGCLCQPEYQPERARSYKIISISILKSMNNKWIHIKAQLAPFTHQMTKAGSSASYHTVHTWLTGIISFYQTIFECFWKPDHCIHYLKYICFWKWNRMIMIIHH